MKPTQLNIQAWGEEDSRLPRWGLAFYGKHSTYYTSSCYLELEWSTRDDGKWGSRSAQNRTVLLKFAPEEIEEIIITSTMLPSRYPGDCLDHNEVHSHGGQSPTRANRDSVVCRCVNFVAEGKYQPGFYIRQTSIIWNESDWGRKIMEIIIPHLTEAPWRATARPRYLP